MLCEALLTSTETPKFLHNYANGPDGSMMSAFLFDILALHSAACVQTHATCHTFKVSAPTPRILDPL